MRIPSQFNDSSLYRPRRGEKNARKPGHVPGGVGTGRRLIRLGAALLLVIVVMREARRPAIYQTFFGNQRAGWVPVATATSEGRPSRSVQSSRPARSVDSMPSPPIAGQLVSKETSASTREGAPESSLWESAQPWIDLMDVPLQRAWIRFLVHVRSERVRSVRGEGAGGGGEGGDLVAEASWKGLTPEQIGTSTELLGQVSVADETVRREVRSGLEAMQGAAESGRVPPALWDRIRSWADPTLDALDRAALSRVADGTFWTGADSDAFYLQLSQSDELVETGAITVGTLPLLQQPEIYRGRRIRLDGTLQLAQRIDTKETRLGVDGYWKLWIIPGDGGIRPTVLLTRSLPDAVRRCLTEDGKWDRTADALNPDGNVMGIGRFVKLLPYRSSIGADLAPVAIGRIAAVKGNVRDTAVGAGGPFGSGTRDATAQPGDTGGFAAGWLGILIAVIGGVVIAAMLMYRSAIDAKRTRRLRALASHRGELDLSGLENRQTDPDRSTDTEATS